MGKPPDITSTRRHRAGLLVLTAAFCPSLQIGWSKEKLNSRIIRNNVIHITVDRMGCGRPYGLGVSKWINTTIFIMAAAAHEYFTESLELLHAAIDVEISPTSIHNCTLGTGLTGRRRNQGQQNLLWAS